MMKKYRVNDMFYSLQGEGYNTGRASVFIRLAGCNLQCPFCDTDFSSYQEMSGDEIVRQVLFLKREAKEEGRVIVVLTGGEPTLQVDQTLVAQLQNEGFMVAMESNGTKLAPPNLDWLTVSPKGNVVVEKCDEVKCIFDGERQVNDYGIVARYYYLQPCDMGDTHLNQAIVEQCVDYIKQHPRWRLSLQTHKLAGFK
ncbi:MAG: radical SAM protein [Prevotella sp.]|nr:radical SAM protein [Prevotella sp.]